MDLFEQFIDVNDVDNFKQNIDNERISNNKYHYLISAIKKDRTIITEMMFLKYPQLIEINDMYNQNALHYAIIKKNLYLVDLFLRWIVISKPYELNNSSYLDVCNCDEIGYKLIDYGIPTSDYIEFIWLHPNLKQYYDEHNKINNKINNIMRKGDF